MSEARVVSVALPLPLDSAFSYRLPEGVAWPERGVRVLVPFGRRRVIGVVTGRAEAEPKLKLKDVASVLDEVPLVMPPLLDLAEWVSDYYMAPIGECMRLAFPPAGMQASRAYVRLSDGVAAGEDPVLTALVNGPLPLTTLAKRLGHDPSSRLLRLRQEGKLQIDQELHTPGFRTHQVVALRGETDEPKGAAQREVLHRLRESGGEARLAELVREKPSLRSAALRLVALGVLTLGDETETRTPAVVAGGKGEVPDPTRDQENAMRALHAELERAGFHAALVQGVTGSGKTEVYFRAVAKTLEMGRTALILVPEIALTPMLVRAAVARFGSTVSVLHSELSAGERHDQWWRIREGESRVAVGARSAVFAPLPDLGLVVVDEEHEGSYKQEERPRYHARDVAVYRARLEGALALLGSATPSLESWENARRGKYTVLRLPQRIGPRGLPRVEIVDRRAILRQGSDPILTPPLLAALEERLQRKQQALLLLNRRGYATLLLCRECGTELLCPNCSVSLTVHDGGRSVLCHYCGHQTRTPKACSSCQGEYLRLTGYGTERVLDAVKAALPQARVDRLDRDRARRRGAVAETLAAFERGEIDVLVGTQMIAKGHDFPNVTLVGVIDSDVGLGLPDFRSAERTFQLLTQVAGRAGRGEVAGDVILQSYQPDHYALRLACSQDYEAFVQREMEFRTTMAYPPTAALINVVFRSRVLGEAVSNARNLASRLRASSGQRFRVLGPALAPLARIKQEHRCQVVLKGPRSAIKAALRSALGRIDERTLRGMVIDVDPVSLM